MTNVYINRNEEGDFYVLPSDVKKEKKTYSFKVGIIIYLFYRDDIEYYYQYIKKIPKTVDVLLISSNKTIISVLKGRINKENTSIVYKPNRGRDVAALLITAKDFVLSHKYMAFLHDKKAKKQYFVDETFDWTKSLWDNIIISECYIYNVINLMENEPEIGLSLPVSNIGKIDMDVSNYIRNGWKNNISKIKKIKKQLDLRCEIDECFPPISFGTMFWFRTEALRKLFEVDWKYEDFQKEPMDNDGTISHAIERIFPFVAQDAGYRTCMIMNDSFIGKYLGRVDSLMYGLWAIASNEFGIRYPYQVLEAETERDRFEAFFDSKEKIYIYGAGEIGRSCYKYLTKVIKKQPDGFIDKYKFGQELYGLTVKALDEVKKCDNVGIIVAVGGDYIEDVVKEIKELKIIDFIAYLSLLKEEV